MAPRYPMKGNYHDRHSIRANKGEAQLTFTYGGLKCDLDSRGFSTNGVPIPGRYEQHNYRVRSGRHQ